MSRCLRSLVLISEAVSRLLPRLGNSSSRNGIYRITRRSLRLDVCGSDHPSPFLGFRGDELPEICRGHLKRLTSQLSEPRLDLGVSKGCSDLLAELVDNFGRRVLRRNDAKPSACLVPRDCLTNGWYVRQPLRSLRSRHSHCPQLACGDVFDRACQSVEHDLDLAREEVGERER